MTNWLDDWAYRIPITIDHTKIDEDLTHFPIPITISGTTASGIFDEIGENNKKIAIATEGKIQLYGEIEQWGITSNISLNKPATAISSQSGHEPYKAVDGDEGTDWGSGGGVPRWWRVDLEEEYNISKIEVLLSSSNYAYDLYGSNDDTNWTLIDSASYGLHTLTIHYVNVNYRYIKINVTESDNWSSWVNLYEFNVYTTNNKITLWVSRSDWTISSTEDTTLYLYYDGTKDDNTTYIGDTGSAAAQNVWDSNFAAVYHMNQDPSGGVGCILDSTSNSNDGTPVGGMTSGDLVDSEIGKAIDFDGSDDYIVVSSASLNPGGSDFTLEAIVKTPGQTTYGDYRDSQTIVAKGTTGDAQLYNFYVAETGVLKSNIEGTADQANANSITDVQDNGYHHVAITVDRTLSLFAFYLDGSDDGGAGLDFSGTTVGDINPSQDLTIGKYSVSPYVYQYKGLIGEIRVSMAKRSVAWIKATNATLTNSLSALSAVEEMPTYIFSGTVRVLGTTSSGIELVLFHHPSNDLIGTDFSDSDGSFSISSTYDGTHYLVAFPPAGTNYNAEIIYDIQST
jgi:hypothetical protein